MTQQKITLLLYFSGLLVLFDIRENIKKIISKLSYILNTRYYREIICTINYLISFIKYSKQTCSKIYIPFFSKAQKNLIIFCKTFKLKCFPIYFYENLSKLLKNLSLKSIYLRM